MGSSRRESHRRTSLGGNSTNSTGHARKDEEHTGNGVSMLKVRHASSTCMCAVWMQDSCHLCLMADDEHIYMEYGLVVEWKWLMVNVASMCIKIIALGLGLEMFHVNFEPQWCLIFDLECRLVEYNFKNFNKCYIRMQWYHRKFNKPHLSIGTHLNSIIPYRLGCVSHPRLVIIINHLWGKQKTSSSESPHSWHITEWISVQQKSTSEGGWFLIG